MSAAVLAAVVFLAAGTLVLRLTGPTLVGDRPPPAWLPPAAVGAVAGMVVLGAVDGGGHLVADARLIGLGVAGAALAVRLPFAAVIGLSVAATAAARFLA